MTQTTAKFLKSGMTIEQIIERTTMNAARAIRHPELGALTQGWGADIALFDRRLHCVLTIRDGVVVWDTEGLSLPDASRAGPYTNFK